MNAGTPSRATSRFTLRTGPLLAALFLLPSPGQAQERLPATLTTDLQALLHQAPNPVCTQLTLDNPVLKHGRFSTDMAGPDWPDSGMRLDIQPAGQRSFCTGGGLAVSYAGSGQMPYADCLRFLCASLETSASVREALLQALQAQQTSQRPAKLVSPGATLGWWLLSASLLLALAALAAWRLRPLSTQIGQTAPPVLLASAFAVAAGGIIDLAWQTSFAPAAWLILLPIALGAVWSAARRRGKATLWIAAISGVGLLLRWLWPWLPVNWYLDLSGPTGAHPVFMRRPGGMADLLVLLDNLLPVSGDTPFLFSVLASSFGSLLLCLALLPSKTDSKSMRNGTLTTSAVILSLFLAMDPLQLTLATSGAPHPLAFLAFATALYWLKAATLPSTAGWRPLLKLAAALYCVALVGWTRPEMAWYPLLLPLLVWLASHHNDGPSPHLKPVTLVWYAGGVFLATVAGLVPWMAREHGYTHAAPDAAVWTQWAKSLIPPFFPASWLPISQNDLNPVATQIPYTVFFGLFLAGAWRFRRLHWWLLPLAYIALLVPRAWTPFHKLFLVGPVQTWRYDILQGPLLLYVLALGAAFGIHWARQRWLGGATRIWKAAVLGLAALLLVSFAIQHPLPNGTLAAHSPLPFQQEYRFLRQNLDSLPQNATVLVPWLHGWEEDPPHDIDALLAHPNTLLAWQRPDITWTLWAPQQTQVPPERPLYFFRSAFCHLNLDQPEGPVPEPALNRFKALQRQCQAQPAATEWNPVTAQTLPVSPTGGSLQLSGKQVVLQMYRWVER